MPESGAPLRKEAAQLIGRRRIAGLVGLCGAVIPTPSKLRLLQNYKADGICQGVSLEEIW